MKTTPDAPARSRTDERAAVQRRTLAVVVATQVLGGAGLAAGVTVGALLAQDMFNDDSVSGLPTVVLTLGSAGAAYLIGRITQRYGRRPGLGGGFLIGAAGAAGVTAAAVWASPVLLFASFLLYGFGTATNLQARYAGTDLAEPRRRGTAVSIAMVSTTLGAVAGPNLITPMGHLAAAWGVPALAGPFILAAAAYLIAGLTLTVFLRPDPFLLAQRLRQAQPDPSEDGSPSVPASPGRPGRRGVYTGAAVMIVAQITMTAIMTMTPVHMLMHHHVLEAVGAVIGIHIAAMYLPSLVTGYLVDRIGRTATAVASCATLLLSGVAAALLGNSLAASITALALLGLGWNLGIIAGTALVVDATAPEERAKIQGSVDVLIALSGAGGGAASGIIMAATSYSTLSFAGGILALTLIPIVARQTRRPAPRKKASGS